MELSNTDKQIIETLRGDARQSNRAVGKALGISEETVRRRTHAMVEAGVIHFGIKVSANHMGYHVAAMLTVKITPGNLVSMSIFKAVSDVIHIEYATWTIDQRLSISIAAIDLSAIYEQVSFIRESDGVEDVSVEVLHNEGDWYI